MQNCQNVPNFHKESFVLSDGQKITPKVKNEGMETMDISRR
jgi:hypothetical protein